MDVSVTRHAVQRMRERLGIPKRSAQRQAERAFAAGVPVENMARWSDEALDLAASVKRDDMVMLLHADCAWLFIDGLLITVFRIDRSVDARADQRAYRYVQGRKSERLERHKKFVRRQRRAHKLDLAIRLPDEVRI